jgi:Copper type II ascorbate-dependent monooxygenase, C-terminal domain
VYDLAIPAGAPSTTFTFDTPYYAPTPLTIGSVTGHMHLLGTELRGEVVGASGENRCLLDIPDWDFHWQGSYQLSEPMEVQSGESLRLSCTYDATDRTEDVVWGEGSEDEMCLLYLSRTEPYAGEPEVGVPSCVSGAACSAGCDGDYDCMLECVAPEPSCRTCVQSALTACAPVCAASMLSDLDCAERCIMSSVLIGGSTHACLLAECPDVSNSINECYRTAVNGPECAAALDACGL